MVVPYADPAAARGGQREIAQFVDHEQRRPGVEPHRGCPPAFERGAVAAGGQVGGAGEVGPVTGVRCGAGQPHRQMGLADAGRPNQQHVGRGLEVAAGAQLGDEGTVDAGGGVRVPRVRHRRLRPPHPRLARGDEHAHPAGPRRACASRLGGAAATAPLSPGWCITPTPAAS